MKRYPVSSHVKWNLSAVDYVSEAIIEIIIDTNHEQNELPKTFNINNPVDIVPMDDLISWSKEIGYELYYLEYSNWSKNLSSLDKSNPLYTLKEFFQRAPSFPHSDGPPCKKLLSLLENTSCSPRGFTKSLFETMVLKMQACDLIPLPITK